MTTSIPTNEIINIYQKNWAFTTSTSSRPQIRTGSFGPCYVVVLKSEGCVAMAHLDDTTDVNSITDIFEEFKRNSVEPQNVNVFIAGGWKEHTASFEWGQKILSKIGEFNCKKVTTTHMFTKRGLSTEEVRRGLKQQQSDSSYDPTQDFYQGAVVSAITGKTYLMKEIVLDLEAKQAELSLEFHASYDESVMDSLEIPMHRVC